MTKMFEESDAKSKTAARQKATATKLEDLSEAELLKLREDIYALLPIKYLKDLDLSTEVVLQYQIAKSLQTEVLTGSEESNKKAQVLNACASALSTLVKMQSDQYTSERLKNIESRLIKALEKVPKEYLIEFFAYYESDEM